MRRTFSQSIKPPSVNNTGSYIMMGLGLAGLSYVTYSSLALNRNREMYAQKGETFMSPVVQQRVAKTLGYFGYGLGMTGAIVFALRNSYRAAAMNPWLLIGGSIASIVGTHMVDYQTQYPLKMALYTTFIGMTSLSILPLIQMTSSAIIADAALATGLSMSGLATVAYMSPSEQFLMWGGGLSMACCGMMAISMMGMFYPNSAALYNVWLYGGLALSGALVLYRT